MKVISCFDEIVDGAIGTVTYKVENNGIIIQEATIEISDDGDKAVLKSNKLYTDDEIKIKECFIAIIETLKHQNVSGIYATSNLGDLSLIVTI